jgi:hypothetical protein
MRKPAVTVQTKLCICPNTKRNKLSGIFVELCTKRTKRGGEKQTNKQKKKKKKCPPFFYIKAE